VDCWVAVAAAEAVADSTKVEAAVAGGATSEVPERDSGVKIVGQIWEGMGSVAPEMAFTVLWKKFCNRPVDEVMVDIRFRQFRRQVQFTQRRLAARQAQPSRTALGFEEQVDCRVQSQQGTIAVRGRRDGR
jgi:hypothetical protein